MLSTNSDTPLSTRHSKHPARIVRLNDAIEIPGSDGVVSEVVKITPEIASNWLKANKKNRPVRRTHVAFLSNEITHGNWQVNGQAIIIAENEDILDGQHRLMAIIEAGIPIDSLVIYGIHPEAFATIDTGVSRSGSDALYLHFNDIPVGIIQATAVAAQWCARLEKNLTKTQCRLSNTEVIAYAKKHESLFQCAETLSAYPKEARPLSLGLGTALYEMFTRKNETLAHDFMRALYTGENVTRIDPEWLLRSAFQRDAQRTTKFPSPAKVRMVIKGWNWRRRGMPEATAQTIAIRTDDDQRIRIL